MKYRIFIYTAMNPAYPFHTQGIVYFRPYTQEGTQITYSRPEDAEDAISKAPHLLDTRESYTIQSYSDNEIEKEEQEKREEEELNLAIKSLSTIESRIHDSLDDLLNELGEAGVDVSYFPHRAKMVQIAYAKKFYAEFCDKGTL